MGVRSWKIFAFLQKKCHQQMNKIILSKKFFVKAQKLLQQAIEFEVQEYLELYKQSKEFTHQSPAVRNGYLPEKTFKPVLAQLQFASLE
jgi:hypothetical protein